MPVLIAHKSTTNYTPEISVILKSLAFFLIDYIFDSCEPGLIPKPDTITGCGPECVVDPDCQTGYICQDQKYEHIRTLKMTIQYYSI